MNSFLNFLTQSRKVLTNLIWLIVVILILSMTGRYLYQRAGSRTPRTSTSIVPAASVDWSAVDATIAQALQTAHAKAEEQANLKLDAWVASQMARVDSDFLDWYFGYWTQQVIGLKGIWYWAVHRVLTEQPTMVEQITEDIQEEFSNRVLRPQISQMEIERITREVLGIYVSELGSALSQIPGRYNIPHPDWERHLDDIALLTSNIEAGRSVSLTLKTVAVSSTVAAGMTVKALAPSIGKVATSISAKLAGKATAKIAAKTGAKVAAKSGGKFAGPIVGIGVIIWDVWDHYSTKTVEKPILRQNLADYFEETKQAFLHDPESGILTLVTTLEAGVIQQVRK